MHMDQRAVPLEFKNIKGLENIDKVIEIDQSPIGRTPRSNPATYCGFFTDIRTLVRIHTRSQDPGIYCGTVFIQCKKRALRSLRRRRHAGD